jgi:RHS repeat-associated protein
MRRPKSDLPRSTWARSGLRFYSPKLGRWVNRDPIGQDGGLNICAFLVNAPATRLDPLGCSSVDLVTINTSGEEVDLYSIASVAEMGTKPFSELPTGGTLGQFKIEYAGGNWNADNEICYVKARYIIYKNAAYDTRPTPGMRFTYRRHWDDDTGSADRYGGTVGDGSPVLVDHVIEHEKGHAKIFFQDRDVLRAKLAEIIGTAYVSEEGLEVQALNRIIDFLDGVGSSGIEREAQSGKDADAATRAFMDAALGWIWTLDVAPPLDWAWRYGP